MYQPKMAEEHIRKLYQWGKRLRMPMTRLVNTLLAHAIERLEQGVEHVQESAAPRYQSKRRQKTSATQRRKSDE